MPDVCCRAETREYRRSVRLSKDLVNLENARKRDRLAADPHETVRREDAHGAPSLSLYLSIVSLLAQHLPLII